MPGIRLYQFELTIIDIMDKTDKAGKRYLLAKGYHRYQGIKLNGVHYNAYDSFSAIQLYGSDQLLDETIRRLSRARNGKLILDILDSDLVNKLKDKKILSMLIVYFYDFKVKRIGTRKLIKKLEKGEDYE